MLQKCKKGVWADGAGRGKAAPPVAPKPRPSSWLGRGLCWPCFGGESPAKGTPAGRLSGGLRCCVRPMPICIVCAECLPVRQRQAVGGELRLRFAKTWPTQAPSKQRWSVGPLMLVGLPPHKRTDVGAVGIRRSGVLVRRLWLCDAEISSLWWAKCRQSRFWVRLLVARCLRTWRRQGRPATACTPARRLPWHPHGRVLEGGLGAGGGQGQGGPPAAPSSARESGEGLRWWRLSGGVYGVACGRCPFASSCAECLPVRNGKPSGACFDCDLLKHGQHKPGPSKGWSVGPLMLVGLPPHKRTDAGAVRDSTVGGACRRLWLATLKLVACGGRSVGNPDFWVRLLVARCLRTWRRRRAAATACTPEPSAPGGTHTGRVWSSSSSVARDPEISSTWLGEVSAIPGMQGSRTGAGYALGALASSPSPAKVEASHRQVGPVPRFLAPPVPNSCFVPNLRAYRACLGVLAAVRLPRRSNASWDGGRWLVCSGIAYVMGAHSIVPNVPFSPCAAPLGAAARGGPQGARCVPRPAHGRTCPGRWPIASSPDLSDAEHTVGTRPRPLFAPKASVRRFVRTTPATVLGSSHAGGGVGEECYLVDPASSHMLVSKIKPCM
ncbi:UNVERIFIED_CONTAM: hypothetical protein Sindi_3087100, partial [Sesamum indicum]